MLCPDPLCRVENMSDAVLLEEVYVPKVVVNVFNVVKTMAIRLYLAEAASPTRIRGCTSSQSTPHPEPRTAVNNCLSAKVFFEVGTSQGLICQQILRICWTVVGLNESGVAGLLLRGDFGGDGELIVVVIDGTVNAVAFVGVGVFAASRSSKSSKLIVSFLEITRHCFAEATLTKASGSPSSTPA